MMMFTEDEFERNWNTARLETLKDCLELVALVREKLSKLVGAEKVVAMATIDAVNIALGAAIKRVAEKPHVEIVRK